MPRTKVKPKIQSQPKVTGFRLDPVVLRVLNVTAARTDRTKSEIVNSALRKALAKEIAREGASA